MANSPWSRGPQRLRRVDRDSSSPSTSADKKLEFVYDYLGRRVEKRVIPWDPSLGQNGDWDEDNPDYVRRFAYSDWLPLIEYAVTDPGGPNETLTVLRKYTAGSM